MKKAQFFITCHELPRFTVHEAHLEYVRQFLTQKKSAKKGSDQRQLSILFPD